MPPPWPVFVCAFLLMGANYNGSANRCVSFRCKIVAGYFWHGLRGGSAFGYRLQRFLTQAAVPAVLFGILEWYDSD